MIGTHNTFTCVLTDFQGHSVKVLYTTPSIQKAKLFLQNYINGFIFLNEEHIHHHYWRGQLRWESYSSFSDESLYWVAEVQSHLAESKESC